jgi:hypothetical protein
MKHRLSFGFAVLCVLAAAGPGPAHAQPPAVDAASAQADDLAHRAVDLSKKHQWGEAEALLRQAWTLKRSYDIAGNLGIAEAAQSKWRDAAEHLTFALATFPANGKAAHRELLREKLAAAREQVGAVAIEVDTPGAEVFVDEKSVGTAPLPGEVFVEPGARVIVARLAGRDAARREVTVSKGGGVKVALVLPPVRIDPVAPVPVPMPDRTPRLVLTIASGVLAVGGLAAGAGLTVAANGKAVEALDLRSGHASTCFMPAPAVSSKCTALRDAVSGRTTLSNAATAAFLAGGAFAVASVGLGIWAAAGPTVGPVRVAPAIGAAHVGLIAEGAW